MALYYNLSKVYALSDNDQSFVKQVLSMFLEEVPQDVNYIALGIKEKEYNQVYLYAHKIKPTLDLLGMNIAHDDVLQIEIWSQNKGKRKEINTTFQNIQHQIEKAVKEIKKDFDL